MKYPAMKMNHKALQITLINNNLLPFICSIFITNVLLFLFTPTFALSSIGYRYENLQDSWANRNSPSTQ